MSDLPATSNSFEVWFRTELSDHVADISRVGAAVGYPGITTTEECAALFDRFGPDIWSIIDVGARKIGYKNPPHYLLRIGKDRMLNELNGFKTLMVWSACDLCSERRRAGPARGAM